MHMLTVQTKVLLLLTLLLIIALISLTMGAALLNYVQTRDQNAERLTTALGSFQREFEREIARDKRLFYESLTNSFKTTLAFKAMVLIDSADAQLPARMIELGTLFNATRLAFYYQIDGQGDLQLRLYYDRGLGGTGHIYFEERIPKYRLIQKQADGQITETALTPPSQLFPLTFPAFAQALFLETKPDGLLLVADLPYRSAFNEVNYSLRAGEELGRFLLEKPLDINLPELDNDLGVHFTVYDVQGRRGQGALRMPDLDIARGTNAFDRDLVVRLADADGKTYDAMLRPLMYQDITVGYIAANISQAKTFQKIEETVGVLVGIASGVLLSAFLLMSAVVRRMIAHPLKQITTVTHRQLQGDFEARVELHTMDEYGELGQTFNRLSQQMNTLLHEQRLTIANLTQAEAALRESEARFRRLAENAKDMIYRMSLPDGRYEYVSPAAEAILGYSPKEFYQSPQLIAQVIHSDWLHYFEDAWQKLLLGDVPPSYEYQIRHKSGDIRWLNQRNVLIRDDQGTPIAIEGIVTDITERKQTEEAIRRLNAELEQRVRERTAALESVNKELESFAYVVSHDLKAPLRAISRLTSWLLNDYAPAFDENGKEMAALLIGRVKRMDNLIEGILEYSRIGRVMGQTEQVDLNQLVSDVLDWLSPPSNIQIEVSPQLPSIVGNKTRIQQIFANLIGNAIKFIDNPRGKILVHWEDAGEAWRFCVTDNGPGIDAKYQDKIFQTFQTLHPRDEVESTGIGLAIVKKIVESAGGRVWVKSEVGKGSAFYFTWPK
ncbi:multi-sensor signal transduction histidine kinase [Candidatus Moduliflexus flocculans]|uniref:histidine kinase n=1 Tax=Candidatus Moduliflexus flocculans TaxID=1499966 RepID=A0A0S6VTR5_9BACT|nr:multi-sensor signal transduction histidine kinase [Candidatus Moduliflexus flocculans]